MKNAWQLCPKCDGSGVIIPSQPSISTTVNCDVCYGDKIINTITGHPPKKLVAVKPKRNLTEGHRTELADTIISRVSSHFGVPVPSILEKCNKPQYSRPRKAAWWLMSKWCYMSHEQIAFYFKGRERSTITSGIKTINNCIDAKDYIYEDILYLDILIEEILDPSTQLKATA
jgi:hypothetical protein